MSSGSAEVGFGWYGKYQPIPYFGVEARETFSSFGVQWSRSGLVLELIQILG